MTNVQSQLSMWRCLPSRVAHRQSPEKVVFSGAMLVSDDCFWRSVAICTFVIDRLSTRRVPRASSAWAHLAMCFVFRFFVGPFAGLHPWESERVVFGLSDWNLAAYSPSWALMRKGSNRSIHFRRFLVAGTKVRQRSKSPIFTPNYWRLIQDETTSPT